MGEEKYTTPAPSSYPVPPERGKKIKNKNKKLGSTSEVAHRTVQSTGSPKDWDLITGLQNTSPPPNPTTASLKAYYLQQFLLPIFCIWLSRKKPQGIPKGRKHRRERVISIRPDMAGMLELSDQEFSTIMINMLKVQKNMLKALTEKSGQHARRDGWYKHNYITLRIQQIRKSKWPWVWWWCFSLTPNAQLKEKLDEFDFAKF